MKRLLPLLIAAFLATPAFAHTALVSANPESGAVLNEVPAEVRLTFTEDLLLVDSKNPNKIEVINGIGQVVSGMTQVSGPDAYTALDQSFEPSGDYTVTYRVVSADGHPIEGEYRFTVANPEVISAPVISNEEEGEEGEEEGSNLLIRFIWLLLGLSGIGAFFLLRARK